MNKAAKIADLKARGYDWPVHWDAVELLASSEDCQLNAYLCLAGTPTIGWGETDGVRIGMSWTKEQADAAFFAAVTQRAEEIERLCTGPTTKPQLGAMVSLSYNIGLGGFKRSTVLRAHNAGNFDAAARAFGLWNKARVNGVLQVVRGLTARRAREAALYLAEEESPYPAPSAQAVVEESSMAKSPINVAGATGVGTGAIAITASAVDSAAPVLNQLKSFADMFNLNPSVVLGAVILGVGAVAMYYRHKQRDQGWV